MNIIRLLRQERCNTILEWVLTWVLIGFMALVLVVCVMIGWILSWLERIGCWCVRLFEDRRI